MKVALVTVLIAGMVGTAAAESKKGAAIITLGPAGEPGVGAIAGAYEPQTTPNVVAVASGAPVVLIGIQPHTCAPVLSEGGRGGSGVPLNLTFSDATSNCLSFAAPPPAGAPEGDPESLTPAQLATLAADRAMALAQRPELATAPGRVGLTGLPSYFWLAQEPQPVSATAVAPGITVTAEAYPVSYLWSFGDGTEISTSHSGRPWRKGRKGDIAHTYETRARYDLRVRVVWEARWRIGSGPWRPLGYFANEDSATYPVRQVRSRLTRSHR